VRVGWETRNLGELLSLEYGKPLDASARSATGRFGVFGANGSIGRTDIAYREGPGIIVGRKGSVGAVTLIDDGFWPLDVTYFIEFDRARHNIYFLHYLLQSLDLPSLGKGVKPGLNRNEAYALPVAVPERVEQHRIVAILDQAFAAIATAKANTEQGLRKVREVFDSDLTHVLAELENTSETVPAMELCHRITVGHVGSMAAKYIGTGVPFLRSQNIRPFSVSMENLVYIDEAFHAELGKSQLKAGDVAIVRTGYPGTAAVIPESLGEANCSDLVLIRPKPGVDPHFLALFFNSSFGKKLVAGKLVGAAQKHFNVTAAKEVPVPNLPMSKQQELVARFDELRERVDEAATIYTRKLAALAELRTSLLHAAFHGDL
jgi:type I restriction enzyme S subunit